MTTCNTCNNTIPDPAEQWPNGNGGTLCQECWEIEASQMWWQTVVSLDRADALGESGTAEWEVQP
jgi:hypothetical protein